MNEYQVTIKVRISGVRATTEAQAIANVRMEIDQAFVTPVMFYPGEAIDYQDMGYEDEREVKR